MPEVSVVLPVFNAAETIERAVRSILDQTLRDLELIVVDDGSTDGTAEVLDRIRDARLRRVACPHRGVVAAANTATSLAKAPIIARMDADDFSRPDRLEQQLQFLRVEELDVVGCQVCIQDESGRAVESLQRYQRWINKETLGGTEITSLRFVEFPLVNPTILARRSYFDMGFLDGDFPEDYDLMLRAAAAGQRFGKVPEVLLDWTDRPSRVTRTDARYSANAFLACRRRYLAAGPLRDVEAVDLWGIGKTGKPWLRWLQDREITVRRGYDLDHRKVGQTIHGVEIGHPDGLPVADGTPLLIAVGAEHAREQIRPRLLAQGYKLGRDVWFVA